MKHYWVLGLLGIGMYGVYEYSRGGFWFQHERHVDSPVVTERRAVASTSQAFSWSGALRAGQVIEIKGVNGSVVASRSQGDQVEVLAEKKSRRSDISSVQVEVIERSDGVTICAVYPGRDNECVSGSRGRMSTRNNDVQVNFDVKLPEGVRLIARTVNGSIRATALASDVVANTVNGSIDVSTSGAAQANTVNGSIEASVGETGEVDRMEFQTVNGRITLTLPDEIDAEIEGGTTNGSISSDFPLTIRGQRGPKRVSGVLGNGGERISLQSVNGAIRLIRR